MARLGWLSLGLVAWVCLLTGPVAGAGEPLTITLTTNRLDFSPGDLLQVTGGVEATAVPGASTDFYLGVVLPDGTTVMTFGPGGTPGSATLGNLAALPALTRGVSLASPFTLAPQTLLEYHWTGSEPAGEYLLFAAAVQAGSLADGVLGPGDLLGLATVTLRLQAGGQGDWRAFADSRGVDTTANVLALLQSRAPSLCNVAPAGPDLALPEAMARLVAGLRELAGDAALTSLVAGLAPGREPVVAAAALADRKPQAALAALLVAATSEPQNPAHLVNAAGLASLLGFPAEALGLLAAADVLGPDAYSPLGIPGRALAQNNRGHALLGLGRFAEAAAALAEAVELAPQLSEARVNLGLALLCQGNEERALRFARAGRWRTLGPALPIESEPSPPGPTGPDTIVTIEATQPSAMERPVSPGLLTVRRTGDVTADLEVTYEVSGTATPGPDYLPLPGTVTIPAGLLTVDIPVVPRGDDVNDPDETVVVTLAAGAGYQVGPAGTATVTIGDLLLPAGRIRRAVAPLPPGAGATFDIPQVFDLSLGQEGSLPPLNYPETVEQLAPFRSYYSSIDSTFGARQSARSARLNQIQAQLIARPVPPRLTFQRISDTFIAMYTYKDEPSLHGLVAELDAAWQAARDSHNELARLLSTNQFKWTQASNACPFGPGHQACVQKATTELYCEPIRLHFPRWRPVMARLDAAARALFGPASRYQTALASNIADPLYHEQAMLNGPEEEADVIFYIQLVHTGYHYTNLVYGPLTTSAPYGCAVTPPAPPNDQVGIPQVTDPGACPPALTAAKVQLKFADVLSVSFNCENVELEVAEPGLGFFGQIGFKSRPGHNVEATLFVGAKASVSGLPFSAKEGFFIRADSQQIRDAGFKVSASTLAGSPAGGLKVDSPFNVEFGVAAASQYLSGE